MDKGLTGVLAAGIGGIALGYASSSLMKKSAPSDISDIASSLFISRDKVNYLECKYLMSMTAQGMNGCLYAFCYNEENAAIDDPEVLCAIYQNSAGGHLVEFSLMGGPPGYDIYLNGALLASLSEEAAHQIFTIA